MFTQATIVCAICEKKFHQIDGTQERALAVVRGAMDKHYAADHPDVDRRETEPTKEQG